MAAKKAADGPSNFQSSANGTVVAADATEESITKPAVAAAIKPDLGVKSVWALLRNDVFIMLGVPEVSRVSSNISSHRSQGVNIN